MGSRGRDKLARQEQAVEGCGWPGDVATGQRARSMGPKGLRSIGMGGGGTRWDHSTAGAGARGRLGTLAGWNGGRQTGMTWPGQRASGDGSRAATGGSGTCSEVMGMAASIDGARDESRAWKASKASRERRRQAGLRRAWLAGLGWA